MAAEEKVELRGVADLGVNNSTCKWRKKVQHRPSEKMPLAR
jgi:hypothetical protein